MVGPACQHSPSLHEHVILGTIPLDMTIPIKPLDLENEGDCSELSSTSYQDLLSTWDSPEPFVDETFSGVEH